MGKRQASLLDMFNVKNDLFSITRSPSEKVTKRKKNSSPPTTTTTTATKGNIQMTLDAGQKEIGCTTCAICGMIYNIGTDDKDTHLKYCRSKLTIKGTPKEDTSASNILIIRPDSNNRKRALEVLSIFSQQELTECDNNTFFIKVDSHNVITSSLIISKLDTQIDGVIAVVVACFPPNLPRSTTTSLISTACESLVYEYVMSPEQIAIQSNISRESFSSDVKIYNV